ncbi:hypothetical protein VNO78_08269 [Psophocarpus tetragonolobus]|uniref:Uncharacterized protein n=1 Tax=Psophocarpus tetragonolobus TaxID=3891 RepID=A0AAN9SXM3_PSOTE
MRKGFDSNFVRAQCCCVGEGKLVEKVEVDELCEHECRGMASSSLHVQHPFSHSHNIFAYSQLRFQLLHTRHAQHSQPSLGKGNPISSTNPCATLSSPVARGSTPCTVEMIHTMSLIHHEPQGVRRGRDSPGQRCAAFASVRALGGVEQT